MKKLVILGAGTGGTIMANVMRRKLDSKEWSITIIDQTVEHIYQPGLLFLPFSLYGYDGPEAVKKPRKQFFPTGVDFVNSEIKLIDHKNKRVETGGAGSFEYDFLIIALGVDISYADIPGMTEGKNIFSFYQLEGALQLQRALSYMESGRLVLNIAEMPIKCPVAPIEFVYLADYFFQLKGIRDRIEIVLSTPLGGVFTKPIAASVFSKYLEEKNIHTEVNFAIGEVDHENKVMKSYDGHEIPYDVLVSIPPNLGPDVIDESGLGTGSGFAVVDEHTLRSTRAEGVYVLGDVANVHTSKAGSVTHFMSEIVTANLMDEIQGKAPSCLYDGHSNCFIESGYHKAFLIDFNYDTEPLPGSFPLAGVGPFKLLKETRINHMGKMAFRNIYWNRMLKGKDVAPFGLVEANMSTSGKQMELLEKT